MYHQLGSPEKKALKQRSSECSQVLSSASIMKKATKIFGQIQKLVRFIRHGHIDGEFGTLSPYINGEFGTLSPYINGEFGTLSPYIHGEFGT